MVGCYLSLDSPLPAAVLIHALMLQVGDNPFSDIQGANDFGINSILVRTGVFRGKDNHHIHPATTVQPDVLVSAFAEGRISWANLLMSDSPCLGWGAVGIGQDAKRRKRRIVC
jgi:hypothetical protein